MQFTPFNWYKAGLKSPVEYYRAAAQYTHTFENVIVDKTVQNENAFSIYGKCKIDNICYAYDTHITKYDVGERFQSSQDEGDFTILSNGSIYRIVTTINTEHAIGINKRMFVENPMTKIKSELPTDVIKIALLVLQLEI